MKNHTIMGSISTAKQRKKGLTLLLSFSFIVFAGLLTGPNEALAMLGVEVKLPDVKQGPLSMKDFEVQYGRIEGYRNASTADVNKALSGQGVESGTYIFKPSNVQGTQLFVPAIFYKSNSGDIKVVKLETLAAQIKNLQEMRDKIEAMKTEGLLKLPYKTSEERKREAAANAPTEYYTRAQIEEIFQKYPQIFGKWSELPESIRATALQFLMTQRILEENYSPAVRLWAYNAIKESLGFPSSIDEAGYQFVADGKLLPRERQEPPKPSEQSWNEADKKLAVQNYKIHLMPKTEDMPLILVRLLEEIKKNASFASSLDTFKIKTAFEKQVDSQGNVMPLVVIYPKSGKQNAQVALNTLYNLFKDVHGLDKVPRYNQKITDLIYYAQGDADYKNKAELKDYFEQPGMIHYKSDFVIPGHLEDYTLKLPTES